MAFDFLPLVYFPFLQHQSFGIDLEAPYLLFTNKENENILVTCSKCTTDNSGNSGANSENHNLHIFNISTKQLVKTIPQSFKSVVKIIYHDSIDSIIVVSNDSAVFAWSIKINSTVDLSPDSYFLATNSLTKTNSFTLDFVFKNQSIKKSTLSFTPLGFCTMLNNSIITISSLENLLLGFAIFPDDTKSEISKYTIKLSHPPKEHIFLSLNPIESHLVFWIDSNLYIFDFNAKRLQNVVNLADVGLNVAVDTSSVTDVNTKVTDAVSDQVSDTVSDATPNPITATDSSSVAQTSFKPCFHHNKFWWKSNTIVQCRGLNGMFIKLDISQQRILDFNLEAKSPIRWVHFSPLSANLKYSKQRQKQLVYPPEKIFSFDDPQIQFDMLLLISQYLYDHEYNASAMSLQGESQHKLLEYQSRSEHLSKCETAISQGKWEICIDYLRLFSQHHTKNIQYEVYRQQFLEHIHFDQLSQARDMFQINISPFESTISLAEYRDLCYLLAGGPQFKKTKTFSDFNISVYRARIIMQLRNLERATLFQISSALPLSSISLPPKRLETLVAQAVAYQAHIIEDTPSRHIIPRTQLKTLKKNYSPFGIRGDMIKTSFGHTDKIKTVRFLGISGDKVVTGSSDTLVKIWHFKPGFNKSTESPSSPYSPNTVQNDQDLYVPPEYTHFQTLKGHSSRIWDTSCSLDGKVIATASADHSARIWAQNSDNNLYSYKSKTLGHDGDVYTIDIHPQKSDNWFVATGGYDKSIQIHEKDPSHSNRLLTKSRITKFKGPITDVTFHPYGHLLAAASKDFRSGIIDLESGIVLHYLTGHFGEVTCCTFNSSGKWLVTSSKDNSNYLWDLRVLAPVKRFRGHRNTCKNYIRCGFGPSERFIISGSEEGLVPLWDIDSCELVKKLGGKDESAQSRIFKPNTLYTALWNEMKGVLVASSEEHQLRMWSQF